MSVLSDILEWSYSRPAWQRDALRRIVTQEIISEEDITELHRMCLAQHDIINPDYPALNPIPLSVEHLPQTEDVTGRVQLIEISDVQGVNALAQNQHLGFQLDGMTIIFGYNGSGKSGYARILRSLCNARARDTRILQNAFSEGDQFTPSATVMYKVGDIEQSENWEQGQNSPTELRQISFFDTDCAAVHVDEVNELAFTPFGLDILPKLASICQRINSFLDEKIVQINGERQTSLIYPQADPGTIVHTKLAEISSKSNIEDFKQLSALSGEEIRRIDEINEILRADPLVKAQELRNAVRRLQQLLSNIRKTERLLSTDSIQNIKSKLLDAITKKNAAILAAEKAFGSHPLPGVGEEVWQELWKAARNYSEQQAYPGQEYPFIGDDSRCVLCQQILKPDAKERLVAFEQFIRADTQRIADEAQDSLNLDLLDLRRLTVGLNAFKDYLPFLPIEQHDLNKSIQRFFRIAWIIRRRILHSCSAENWIDPSVLPHIPDLESAIKNMLDRAEELEHAAVEEKREALIREKNELTARQWLGSVINDVEMEIQRLKKLSALNAAKGDTATTGITRKSSDLANIYVTDALQNKMREEIDAFGAGYLGVIFESAGGQFGQKRFRIALRGAAPDTKVRHILSEGEYRCIALAGFLSELSTEQSGSALIFDDPVCSLDHKWRRKVANRLVQLASKRQVIIFTHDIVFMSDLVGYCKQRNVAHLQKYMYRGQMPGECTDGLPWVAMKVNDRIGRLNGWFQKAETTFRHEGIESYESEARRIYGHLRETWERAVEEVLFNGTIRRFEPDIQTQRLRHLSDIIEEDLNRIENGMTKCSRFLEGHDEAQAVMDQIPYPDELRQDIDELINWVKDIRRRRQ